MVMEIVQELEKEGYSWNKPMEGEEEEEETTEPMEGEEEEETTEPMEGEEEITEPMEGEEEITEPTSDLASLGGQVEDATEEPVIDAAEELPAEETV